MPRSSQSSQSVRVAVRPLAVTDDEDLLEDLLRLAAAAGVELDVATAAAHARPYWPRAPLVVVGADLADEVAALSPPARTGVLLVAREFEHQRDHTEDGRTDIWRLCVAVGAQRALILPEAEEELADQLAEALEPAGRTGEIVCVIGGRGGAGASTLAAALGVTGARHDLRTLLVDADPLGCGIDLTLGQETVSGARWPEFVNRQGRISYSALRAALPTMGALTVLSWDRGDPVPLAPDAMRTVLAAGARGCDLVVVDLPRYVGDAPAEALARAGRTLVVVPAEVRAVVAANRVLGEVRRHTQEAELVIREAAGDRLPSEVIAATLGAGVFARMPAEPGLDDALERGDPPAVRSRGPLAAICRELIEELS